MKIKDWNEAHKIKEQIEDNYPVFVHILGRGCLVTTSCPKLLELNNWNDCLAMFDDLKGVENLSGLEWFEKTTDLFYEKIKSLNYDSISNNIQ